MAGGMDDNRSQFFITLGPCDEFQDNHTVFAKVIILVIILHRLLVTQFLIY